MAVILVSVSSIDKAIIYQGDVYVPSVEGVADAPAELVALLTEQKAQSAPAEVAVPSPVQSVVPQRNLVGEPQRAFVATLPNIDLGKETNQRGDKPGSKRG